MRRPRAPRAQLHHIIDGDEDERMRDSIAMFVYMFVRA
jgi:hypothetical protein